MSLRRLDSGRWRLDEMANGIRHRETLSSRLTYQEAMARQAEVQSRLLLGQKPAPMNNPKKTQGGTLQELLEHVNSAVWDRAKAGEHAYQRAKRCVELIGSKKTVRRINQQTVTELRGKLMELGHSPATTNRYLSAFGKLLTEAVEMGWLAVRPQIKRLRENEGRLRWLRKEEWEELCAALEVVCPESAALATVLVATGLRLGEALVLTWRDVDQSPLPEAPATEGVVHVVESKSGRPRTVPLIESAGKVLKQQWEDGRPKPFSGLHQRTFQTRFREAREMVPDLAGDAQVTPHVLRHTCASWLVAAGVPLRAVKEWLGHEDIRTTMRYAHLSPDALAPAAAALEKVFGAGRKK